MGQRIQVIVGSRNPVKVQAAAVTFQRAFPNCEIDVHSIDAPSGVRDQPMDAAETLTGARNRVHFAKQQLPEADFYVAFEGGVDTFSYGVATFAYVVVADANRTQVGRTADLPLPAQFYQALQTGEELGDVLDRHFRTTNVKQRGGAIGLLTDDHESRESTYQQALMLALAPFLHSALF